MCLCSFLLSPLSTIVQHWKPSRLTGTYLLLCIRYQFVPQMIFLNSLFGYLSLLIIIKWCTGSQADLYHVMIYMFLSPFEDLGENQLFWGQGFIQAWPFLILMIACLNSDYLLLRVGWFIVDILQIILLFAALVAVPWMLFPKPFILKKLHSEVLCVYGFSTNWISFLKIFFVCNFASWICGYAFNCYFLSCHTFIYCSRTLCRTGRFLCLFV